MEHLFRDGPLPLVGTTCTVRAWRPDDAASLARHANDIAIWRTLRDAFPQPYSLEDARAFIAGAERTERPNVFAIVREGAAVGGIGVKLGVDVERVGAELGYWLGTAYWARGIVTEAVRLVTPFVIEQFSLTRVFALPYAHNVASHRVLEKAGYVLEGRLRRSAIKEGVLRDQLLYAYVPD